MGSKNNDPIKRVKCAVDSCEFWSHGNQCMAKSIEVVPPNASDSQGTDCQTFRPRLS